MTDIVKNLLPCPFCGGTDDENNACQIPKVTTQSFISPIRKTAYRVECACGSYGPSDLVWSKAREMWNSRPVAVSQTAWQPIETAPKDGMCFLACTGNWMTVCCWNKHRDDWCTNGPGYAPYGADERPTHWMPLPEAPALSSAERARGE